MFCSNQSSRKKCFSENLPNLVKTEMDEYSQSHVYCGTSFRYPVFPGNCVFSPFAVESLLTLLSLGAGGLTSEEIRFRTTYCNCTPEKAAASYRSATSALSSDRRSFLFKLTNKILIRDSYQVKAGFRHLARNCFSTDVEYVNFRKTHHLLENLIFGVPRHAKLFAISDLHFRAQWEERFFTKEEFFYQSKTDCSFVKFLTNLGTFGLCQIPDRNISLVELKFKGDASMVIIIPNSHDDLLAAEGVISDALHLTSDDFTPTLLYFQMPKFKVVTKINLERLLPQMGVERVFCEGAADLSGIAGREGDLYLDGIFHRNFFLEVGENGVETDYFPDMLSPGRNGNICLVPNVRTIVANIPFVFFIKVKGLMVFAGEISDPSSS